MNSNRDQSFLAAPVETPARLMPSLTAVLWVGCAIVGAMNWLPVGLLSAAQPAKPEAAVVQVQIATNAPRMAEPREARNVPPKPSADLAPPPPQPATATPSVPPLLAAVAALPNPAIAFPQSVATGQITTAAQAVPSAAATTAPATAPSKTAQAVERLTFGQGEGAQPAPEYPREAALAQQQGTVTIVFTIDESGRVSEARVSDPSRFPLLNQAALRAVRDTWQFAAGTVRLREVSIDFRLSSH